MSLMNLLQQAQGGQGLSQLASQFGIDEAQAGKHTLQKCSRQPSAKPPNKKPKAAG